MVPARLPELSAVPDIEYMRHMFKLHLDDAQCAAWWTRTLDKYSSNTRNAMKAFDNQMHIIKHTGGKKAAAIERLIARLRSELQRRQEVIGEHIVLPYGLHVKRLVVEKCKVMSSAALPLWLAFEGVTPPAGVNSTQSPDFFVRLAGRRAALRMFVKCARTPMAIMAGVRAPMRELAAGAARSPRRSARGGARAHPRLCPPPLDVPRPHARTPPGSTLRSGSVVQREVTARSHHHHADSFSFAAAPGAEGNDTNARSLLFSEWLHKKAPQRAAWKKRWCAVEAVRVCGAFRARCGAFGRGALVLHMLTLSSPPPLSPSAHAAGPRRCDTHVLNVPAGRGRTPEGVVRARARHGPGPRGWRRGAIRLARTNALLLHDDRHRGAGVGLCRQERRAARALGPGDQSRSCRPRARDVSEGRRGGARGGGCAARLSSYGDANSIRGRSAERSRSPGGTYGCCPS